MRELSEAELALVSGGTGLDGEENRGGALADWLGRFLADQRAQGLAGLVAWDDDLAVLAAEDGRSPDDIIVPAPHRDSTGPAFTADSVRLMLAQVEDQALKQSLSDLLNQSTLWGSFQTVQSWSTYQQDTRNEGYEYGPPIQMNDYTSADGRPFEQVYPPGLYQVEFTPLVPGTGVGAGEHRHYVYVPANGGPAQIISGNERNGRLTVIISLLAGSDHDLNSAAGRNSMDVFRLDVRPGELGAIWSAMSDWAGIINDTNLNYDIVNQNSNSVFRTLTDLFGLRVDNFGLAQGFDNSLVDEVLTNPPIPSS
ncbi:MAG: hypothetical protein ACOYKM_14180 [Caulobacterales bacterium]